MKETSTQPATPVAPQPEAPPRPIFVVGMNGSGTTMLLDCLGRHPQLYAFPRETRLIPYLMSREAGFGDLKVEANYRRLWDEVSNLFVFREANGGVPVPMPADWQQRPRSLASVLDAVFGHFAAAQGKHRWCEKTPQHVQHIAALAVRFPQARFVHMVRDGRDCAASFARRWKRQPELTIFRWKKVVLAGRRQGEALSAGSYREVRYEDLTAQPEATLRSLCDFLGLPFDAAILESAQPYLQGAGEGGRSLRENSGKWRRQFDERLQRRLERIAGRVLASCGYQTNAPDADVNPPGWKRRYWSAAEILRQYGREIGLKLKGDIQRPWRVILMKPLIALRQRQHNEF
ncbi:MAG: sulfotransferase [Steroidobacteraceae bacterium]